MSKSIHIEGVPHGMRIRAIKRIGNCDNDYAVEFEAEPAITERQRKRREDLASIALGIVALATVVWAYSW